MKISASMLSLETGRGILRIFWLGGFLLFLPPMVVLVAADVTAAVGTGTSVVLVARADYVMALPPSPCSSR